MQTRPIFDIYAYLDSLGISDAPTPTIQIEPGTWLDSLLRLLPNYVRDTLCDIRIPIELETPEYLAKHETDLPVEQLYWLLRNDPLEYIRSYTTERIAKSMRIAGSSMPPTLMVLGVNARTYRVNDPSTVIFNPLLPTLFDQGLGREEYHRVSVGARHHAQSLGYRSESALGR